MAYTPKLSYVNICMLRKIDWSLGKPMTYAIDWVVHELVNHLDNDVICKSCEDQSKCSTCPFHQKGQTEARQ